MSDGFRAAKTIHLNALVRNKLNKKIVLESPSRIADIIWGIYDFGLIQYSILNYNF